MKVIIEKDRCISCGQCQDVCETGAMQVDMEDLGAYKGYKVDQEECTKCMSCIKFLECPGEAIKVLK